MSHSTQQPPAGWYPDPAGSGDERYWDGGAWSQVTRPQGGLNAPVGAGVGQGAAGQEQFQQRGAYASQTPHAPYGVPGYGRPTPVLAGWWWRVLAYVVDYLVFMIPLFLIQSIVVNPVMPAFETWLTDIILGAERGATTLPPFPPEVYSAYLVYFGIVVALWIVYRIVMVARFGATVGQMATSLRVVRDGDTSLGLIGWGPASVRGILAIVLGQIPLLNIVNWLMPAFTAKKQTFHDMAAKTVVVKTK